MVAQTPIKVLIVDDDPRVAWVLAEGLKDEGYQTTSVTDGQAALKNVLDEKPTLMILDIMMPDMDGLEVLERVKAAEEEIEVIMLSAHGETKNVVRAMQLGAADFINKPFDVEEVKIHIGNVLERSRLRREIRLLRSELQARGRYENLIGDSSKMREMKKVLEQVADSELTVLIRGESGTGKEIVARIVHQLSVRRDGPFIKVNCAAIPKELLEAELFGYEKGAFTGAHKRKPGRFELAVGGTIFLDEIGDMSLELQAKLLQVLEHQEFVRVGGTETIRVDVRIVCATNRNLEKALAEGEMREDLFYRLNEVTLPLPPLRERRSDIPLLVEHFLIKYGDQYHRPYTPLSPESLKQLQDFHWPGNVRQLENVIKQIVVRGDEQLIQEAIGHSVKIHPQIAEPEEINDFSLKRASQRAIRDTERALIKEALDRTNWNRKKAAKMLEISYRSLLYKIKEYELNNP